jgi:hypothetical protein
MAIVSRNRTRKCRRLTQRDEALRCYYRVGCGLVGHGEVGCAGDAVTGAAAGAAAGRAAGFFAAGFLLAGFLATGADAPGVSSTTTGLGRNLGASPDAWTTSSLSASGW